MASNSSSEVDVLTSTTSVVCFSGTKTELAQGTTVSWIIEGMENKVRSFPPGKSLKTDMFSIKDTMWHCHLWPNGNTVDMKGNISFTLVSDNVERIMVKCECRVGKSDEGWLNHAHFTQEFSKKGQDRGYLKFLTHKDVLKKENRIISKGRMELMIKVSLIEEGTPSPQITLLEDTSEINRLRKLSESFSNLHQDKNSSDFLILCGDVKFPVHRNVLKARSSFFSGLFSNNFAENNAGQIIIENMDSGTVKNLIDYIYTGKIKDLESYPEQLLKAADMYDFPLLRKSCEDELISTMNLDNVVDLFVLAEDHNATELRAAAKKMILENKAAIVKQEGWDTKLGTLVIELFQAVALKE